MTKHKNEVSNMLERQEHNLKELIFALNNAGGDASMILTEDLRVSDLMEMFTRNGIRMTLDVERPDL